MSRLRTSSRLILATTVTFAAWFALLFGSLPALALGRRMLGRWRAFVMGTWGRTLARAIGMRIHVRGTPGKGLIVANHLSYLDIVVLGAATRKGFVSKAEVARWPFMGWMARTAGTVFVDRGKKRELARTAGRMSRKMSDGQGLCLFPEGTSSPGAAVQAFRSSLLEPAAEAEIPVGYAALHYSTPPGCPPAHLSVCWWGEMTLAPHVLNLLRMPSFDATVAFGSQPIADTNRKLLAAKLHHAVAELFHPTVDPSEVCLTSPT
ncbi:MAG: 1-acyl-sn-glycerol-3-phosphate acyltransferase [Planctomycetes bacterium]|jgi:1-acyl-sn-glycerol-3-phosphate acyltransferase|nr:1-acyl-sn-glycerol-3-phosphate acyltransferase [Planctomycetota bacterium]